MIPQLLFVYKFFLGLYFCVTQRFIIPLSVEKIAAE